MKLINPESTKIAKARDIILINEIKNKLNQPDNKNWKKELVPLYIERLNYLIIVLKSGFKK